MFIWGRVALWKSQKQRWHGEMVMVEHVGKNGGIGRGIKMVVVVGVNDGVVYSMG